MTRRHTIVVALFLTGVSLGSSAFAQRPPATGGARPDARHSRVAVFNMAEEGVLRDAAPAIDLTAAILRELRKPVADARPSR